MRKAGLDDQALCQAVSEMAEGLIDADLGGNVVKKRVPLPGRGKRGGARTIVATNRGNRWFFLYGFEKNERANIDKDEIKALQELAAEYLAIDGQGIEQAVSSGKFMEVTDGNKT